MKKASLIIGFIALLVFGYVGLAWFTGNQIEKNIDAQIIQLTQQLEIKQDKYNITDTKYDIGIFYSNYRKNLFSTQLHLTVTLKPITRYDSDLEPLKIFDDNVTIHHGPFPIAALSKGVFTPQMVWIDYQTTKQASPELWKLAGNQPFITGYAGISYFNDIQVKLSNKAILYKPTESSDIEELFEISKGDWSFASIKESSNILANIQLDHFTYTNQDYPYSIQLNKFNLTSKPNKENRAVSYELNAENISYSPNERYHKLEKYSLSNLKTTANISDNIDLSDLELAIDMDKLVYTLNEQDPLSITINQLAFNLKNRSNTDNSNDGLLTSSIGSLIVGKHNLGTGVIDFDYQNINLNQSPPCLFHLKHCIENNKEGKNFTLSLNKFNWHTEVGDINIRFIFDYLPAIEKDQILSDIERINEFKVNVDVPLDVLNSIFTKVRNWQTSPIPQDKDESRNVEGFLKWLFSKNIIFTLNKGDTKGLFSDIDCSRDSQIMKANGKTYIKEDFFDRL